MFHGQDTLWPNYILGVPHWHTILLSNPHPPPHRKHTFCTYLSLSFCLYNGVFHQNLLVWSEWNRLSGQLSWIKAFLTFCPSYTPSTPSNPPYPQPSFFSHHQQIKPPRRNINWWVPSNEFTHGYVLQSPRSLKNWGEPVMLKLQGTWWNASVNEFIHHANVFKPGNICTLSHSWNCVSIEYFQLQHKEQTDHQWRRRWAWVSAYISSDFY